jgi:hypothetical protein
MRNYILVVLSFLSMKGTCQSNCDCFERLYQLSANDTSQSCVDILKDAISFLDTTKRGEYYWEVASLYKAIKQYDSSAVWYEKAVEWGYDLDGLKRYSSQIYSRMDTGRMKAIAFEHRKKVDFSLYEQFVAQLALDQSVRSDALFSTEKYWNKLLPLCEKSFIDSMYQRVDDSTFRFLKWVFENYRFPTFRRLGFFPGGIMAMIMHITAYKNEQATYLLDKLEEFANSCEYRKCDILVLKDRQKYIKEKKTNCGLFGSGQRYLNIEDINKADSIRFAYNRLRLKEEAASWNGKLPANYKPRSYPKNYFCLKKYEIK